MKRIISVISVLMLSMMVVLVGCSPAHEHTFSNGYGTDENYHWRIPLCDDIEPEKQPHEFVDGVCSVCDYRQKSEQSTKPSDKTPSGGTQGGSQGSDKNPSGSDTPGQSGSQSGGSTGSETPGQSGSQSGGNQGSGESSGNQDGSQGGSSSGSEQTNPSGGQSGGNTGSETPGQSGGTQSGGNQGSGESSGSQGGSSSGSEQTTPSGGTSGEQSGGNTGSETTGQSGSQSGGNQGSGESSGSQGGGSSSGSEQTAPSGGTSGGQSGGSTGSETPGQSGSQSGGNTGSESQGGETVDPDDIYAFENQYPKDDNTITGEPDASGKVTFRIRVNRYNGRKIGNYSLYPKVRIEDSEGEIVYDDIVPIWAHTMYSETELNMLDIKLDEGEYKVYPYNIPEGFEYETYYTISPEKPLLDLKLTCHPLENKTLDKIDVNMVMPNITIKGINKTETTTLNELLKEGQIVVFMFFNSGCYWCHEEAATFKKIYNENPGKITYVFFDNADDEDGCINTVKSWYGPELAEKLYIVCDKKEDKLYNKLVNGGHVPRNVYIDNGGYVFLVTSGTPEEWLNRILYFNAFDMPEKQTSQK